MDDRINKPERMDWRIGWEGVKRQQVTGDNEEEKVEYEKESPNQFSCHHPNLRKTLERRQAKCKQLQMSVIAQTETGKWSNSGVPTGWAITEITNDSSIKMANQYRLAEKHRDLKYTI